MPSVPPAPLRALLRALLRSRFRAATKFDAFCLDHFPEVYQEFTNGMDRTSRENLLLTEIDPSLLWAQLHAVTSPVPMVGTHGLSVGDLEALTSTGNPFLDPSRLVRWLVQVERQVCMVRCGDEHGTGFLVAPDLVMTCYHVVKSHLSGQVARSDVAVRFDYRLGAVGTALPPYDADWVALDAAWQIPHAPYSEADLTLTGEPAPSELDYAILQLSTPKGTESAPGDHTPRGWIDLSVAPPSPQPSTPILIVQHPGNPPGESPRLMPLKVSFATPGFDGANSNGTRYRYLSSTLPGSSGSPVFDARLRPVALHHNRGTPHGHEPGLVRNNRGIPLARIRDALPAAVLARLVAPPT